MANKRNKSRKQQRARRPGAPGQQNNQPLDVLGSSASGQQGNVEPTPSAPRPQPSAATSRYASAVSGPRRGGAATATTGTIDIDERVPYFGKDLRRILITAAVMVVLIVGASFLLR